MAHFVEVANDNWTLMSKVVNGKWQEVQLNRRNCKYCKYQKKESGVARCYPELYHSNCSFAIFENLRKRASQLAAHLHNVNINS